MIQAIAIVVILASLLTLAYRRPNWGFSILGFLIVAVIGSYVFTKGFGGSAQQGIQLADVSIENSQVDSGLAIFQKMPLLAQMSPRFQNLIPSIDYEIHVYAESENIGFVRLNGSIAKVGTTLSADLRVIAILKDSVVLDYQGTQFRLLALNSWVNFN